MSHPTLSGFVPPLLVGREREQAVLRDHLAAARAGHGSLVLVGGEAGIGKTTLADALCRDAADQGMFVLVGRCYDLTETPPYGPWADCFGRYQPADGIPPRPASFSARGVVGAVESQAALFQEVQDFLAALSAPCPVLLFLDDLHWSDPASLDLLRFLTRHLSSLSLLIVVAYRVDELTRRHPLYALVPILVREAAAERLNLQQLSDGDVRRLVAARYELPDTDEDRLVTYLQARAEGNAFFLAELLRTLEETRVLHGEGAQAGVGDLAHSAIPLLLRQVIDGRLARLGDEAQRLLVVAAIIGQEIPLDVWATVAQTDEGRLLETIEHAVEAHILEEAADGTAVRFAHALIREALYEGEPAVRRRREHRRIGETLAAQSGVDPDAVAFHFQRADDPRALSWLLKAGERAQAAYAWTTAAQRFEAALALMERADAHPGERGWLLLRLVRLLGQVEVAKARGFVEEAYVLACLAEDGALAAYARLRRGQLAILAGEVVDGMREMEAGAEALGALSEAERGQFAAHAASVTGSSVPESWGAVVVQRAFVGRFREARELGERIVAETEGKDEEARQSVRAAYFGLGYAYAALGMPDEAAAMFAVSWDLSLRAVDLVAAADSSICELMLLALPYHAEDVAGRRRLPERAQAAWERASGAVPATVLPRFQHAPVLIVEGGWEEAERLAAAGGASRQGSFGYRSQALSYLATLSHLRGDSERAWWAVREKLPAGAETEPGTVWPLHVVVELQRVAAALLLDMGDLGSAQDWLDAHDRWLAWSGAVLGFSEGTALWARYYRQLGEMERAYDFAHQALRHATDPRQPLALIAAHRLLGELDTVAGRYDDVRTHLDTALHLADACAAPYERALTMVALAEFHAAFGNRADAEAALAEVRAICLPLGAKPALARADALAARLGAAPVPSVSYPAGLTAREVEVLRLVAEGLTDAQVAERLFLSTRTVNQHLRTIYNKLGVSSRAAATRFVTEHGLLP